MNDGTGAAGVVGAAAPRRQPPEPVVRPPASPDEYRACVELQRLTWGPGFDQCVPAAILKVSRRVGGVTAGAFDGGGRLLGFVFGLTGLEAGRVVHWSHVLAVRPECRDLGVGRRLKAYQREALLRLGVETAYWSFDPLVARNAHLSLNRLGARAVEYVPQMYGGPQANVHAGTSMDGLIVAWPLRDERVEAALAGNGVVEHRVAGEDAPVVNDAGRLGPHAGRLPPAVRIEVPEDVVALEAAEPGAGLRWREATRRAFQGALGSGYRVRGFYRDAAEGRCFYVLSRDGVREA